MRGHREIKAVHHIDEGATVAFLQPWVLGKLLANGRMRASLVFMRRKYLQCWVERQQAFEQAVIKRSRVTTWQVGASGSSDQQRVTGEHAVFDAQAHGIA